MEQISRVKAFTYALTKVFGTRGRVDGHFFTMVLQLEAEHMVMVERAFEL